MRIAATRCPDRGSDGRQIFRPRSESFGLNISLRLQSTRRASPYLGNDLVSLSRVGNDPWPALGIEHRGQPAATFRGVDTHLRIEAHIDFRVGVGLPHKPNSSLRDPGTRSTNSRCSSMNELNEFTNGQNGRTSKPCRRGSSSASPPCSAGEVATIRRHDTAPTRPRAAKTPHEQRPPPRRWLIRRGRLRYPATAFTLLTEHCNGALDLI